MNSSATPEPTRNTQQQGANGRLLALLFAMGFPTLVTLVYFLWLKESEASTQQVAYAVLKVIQFGFPIGWFLYDRKFFDHLVSKVKEPTQPQASSTNLGIGFAFGLFVAALLFGIYFFILPEAITHELNDKVREKISGMGLDSFWKYVGLATFYALGHSFLEEYYWRWFVFRGWLRHCSTGIAVAISSLGFMAHHVVVLGVLLEWSWLTWLLSFSVAIGGAAWAMIYHRTQRMISPWVSHLIVDAAIFGLGYLIIRDVLQS